MSGVLGAMILIAIIVPWFLIALAAILAGYLYVAIFYRASARELMVSISPSSRANFIDMVVLCSDLVCCSWLASRFSNLWQMLCYDHCSMHTSPRVYPGWQRFVPMVK